MSMRVTLLNVYYDFDNKDIVVELNPKTPQAKELADSVHEVVLKHIKENTVVLDDK